jgi:RNA polymerase sigma factor (sigma-70 family)
MTTSIAQLFSQLPCWTSDAALLERYIHERDDTAFTALVSRHGALVLRLCRRILGDVHAAEDAFQATFLILARKAHSLKQPDALAAWLYGVARRVALKARTKSARRHSESFDETLPDPHPDPLAQLNARELLDILDEEVQRLPAAQRSAFVLCCLEGHTQEEAARILGWTPGSIKGRLERGRQRLQARLQRRGIALSAALALVVVTRDHVAARVPALLLQSTARAALDGGIGGTASALANGVLQAMFLHKLAGVMAVTLTLALAASTTVALVYCGPVAEPPEDKAPAAPVPQKAPKTPGPAAHVDRFGDPLPVGALLRLGTIRYRAGAGINHAALSPDGKLLAAACESGITFFDLATGKPRHLRESGVVNGFDNKGSNIALSPDGKQLVHVTNGGNLRFWDVATGKQIWVEGGGRDMTDSPRGGVAVAMPQANFGYHKVWFPPQGQYVIASSRRNGVSFVEPSTGTYERRIQLSGELSSVAADGKTLVAIDTDHREAVLYDEHGKELRRFSHEGQIHLATLCQGGRLTTVNKKAEIKIWNSATGKEQRTIAGPAVKNASRTPTVVSIAPDGKILYAGTEGGDILRWDLRDGKENSPLRGHVGFVTGLFYTPDGSRLVSVSWDGVIRRWKLPRGEAEPVGEGYASYLQVARSPDGRTIAASNPGVLDFWDTASGKRRRVFSLPAVSCSQLCFAPDGKLLALGCSDATIRLWDVDKGFVRHEWKLPAAKKTGGNERSWFQGLAWSPDGRFLAASMRGDGVRMWEAATGKELWHAASTADVAVAFSSDGKRLVAAGWDKCLTFRDVATGKVHSTLKEERNFIDDIAFSPDGATLATCHHGGNVYLRDPKTGVVRKTLQAHRGVAWSISFSPDGNWLASSGDHTVCVWEVATGAELLCRKGHEGRAYQVAFGTDGRTVLSSSLDQTALLWDIRPSIEPGHKRPLETLWADLADEPARAYRAVWELAGDPKTTSEFLRKKIVPIKKEVDERRVQALLADLDSDDFAIRQKATEELEKAGEQALPAYRKALEGKPSLESRRRLEDLLAKAQRSREDLSGERLRLLRAIEALELAGTPEAREVLQTLAAGAEGARLTEEAKAALKRLQR